MKTIIVTMGLTCALFISGVAQAVPMTWTDVYTPVDAPILFSSDNISHSWTHDLTDDGFHPGAGSGEYINDYTITLDVFDDFDRRWEIAAFLQPGGLAGVDVFEVDYSDVTIGVTLAGLITLNADGMLDVSLTRLAGDFYFAGSTLVANGFSELAATSVPEPGTLVLLAVGLLAIGFSGQWARRSGKLSS